MPYRSDQWIPTRVAEAIHLAHRLGFSSSSEPPVGRLLSLLASQVASGVIGEIGTGCGVGAAWISEGKRDSIPFITVEADPKRAEAARSVLRGVSGVTVLQGDWHELLSRGPFQLLFADGGKAKENEPETLLQAMAPGGAILIDDMTPEEYFPPERQGKIDPVREFWLNDLRLYACELRVTPRTSVILAIRKTDD